MSEHDPTTTEPDRTDEPKRDAATPRESGTRAAEPMPDRADQEEVVRERRPVPDVARARQGGKAPDHPSPNAPPGREKHYAPPCLHRGPFLRLARTACPASPRATVFRCDHEARGGEEVILHPQRRCGIPSCAACRVREAPALD